MDRYLLELNPETKERLDRLKYHPGEPYDQLINRLIDAREEGASLSREEVEEIRQVLRDLREGRMAAREQAAEQPAPEKPLLPALDPQAVKDMEALFSGTAARTPDQELPPPQPADTDPGDLHEIGDFDRRGRSRTPHLDSL